MNAPGVRGAVNRVSSVLELQRLRSRAHHRCIACTHPQLKLAFTMDGPQVLRTSIDFTAEMTSFNGMVHGGLLAFVIDEAMTCALMGKGIYGATADLKLRYRHPVAIGPTAHIRIRVMDSFRQIHRLEAELTQEARLCTTASARFFERELEAGGM